MRMWMIDPKLLCDKHLYGEHGEIHKHRHNFVKKHKIDKRIFPIAQIFPSQMKKRHDELAIEIDIRANIKGSGGHKSPYEQPDISHLPEEQQNPNVDLYYNVKDLSDRCPDCERNIIVYGIKI